MSSSVNAPSRRRGNTVAAISLHCRVVLVSVIVQYEDRLMFVIIFKQYFSILHQKNVLKVED